MVILGISVLLLIYLGYGDFIEAKETNNLKAQAYQRRSVYTIGFLLFMGYALYLIHPDIAGHLNLFKTRNALIVASIVFSFAISYLWFMFFRALDIFEKEKTGPLIIIFVLSCASLFLVFPMGGFLRSFGFSLDGSFIGDFIYCVVVIGVPEEIVKILPFLLMLRFTRFINEPYDYILYGGVCALGFAFIENIQYLNNTNLSALAGRALYSTVSHIFDTSIICYFLAIAHYKKKGLFLPFIKGFALAALAHGFYDFWVITESVSYPLLTVFFFLASIHVLVMMINNLINISPYYKPEHRLRTAKYKFYLTTYLVGVLVLGFVFMLFSRGQEWAYAFAKGAAFFDSYVLMYLVVSFTSLNVVHGYIMPLRFKKMLLPLINRYPNYLRMKVRLSKPGNSWTRREDELSMELPLSGVLTKRLVVNGNFNGYEVSPTEVPESWLQQELKLIVIPTKFNNHLLNGNPQHCRLALIKDTLAPDSPLVEAEKIERMDVANIVALEPEVQV